jgi:hypothetical protein
MRRADATTATHVRHSLILIAVLIMTVRRAACDPCRRSKLACDHREPVCSRCASRGQPRLCVYRSRPFRRRHADASTPSPITVRQRSSIEPSTPQPTRDGPALPEPRAALPTHRYPNPGFLGAYSHSDIFRQVTTHSEPHSAIHDPTHQLSSDPAALKADDVVRTQDIQTLKAIGQLDIPAIANLLNTWTSTGANLTLAQPFIRCSTKVVLGFYESLAPHLTAPDNGPEWASIGTVLLRNTRAPINLNKHSTMDDLLTELSSNVRWEMIGLFLAAVGRACVDIAAFPTLFADRDQRRRLARSLTFLSDACLNACILSDSLTDLRLILNFENGILHSQVDGDQSEPRNHHRLPVLTPS